MEHKLKLLHIGLYKDYMSYSLNSFKAGYVGGCIGECYGGHLGVTRSSDYGSHRGYVGVFLGDFLGPLICRSFLQPFVREGRFREGVVYSVWR